VAKRKQTIRELMTADPVVLDASATVSDAARAMKARDVGDVLVRSDGKLCGIVTDRDLVIRAFAGDPQGAARRTLGEICTRDIAAVAPDAEVDEAIRLMREKAVRRIPVIEGDRPLGIVSLGDLAIARDRESALADISAAPPTR
jgi:CBS domain-containing protein